MKSSTRENVEGKMNQMKGKIKEAFGKVFKNKSLEAKGKTDNLDGHIQENTSKVEKVSDK